MEYRNLGKTGLKVSELCLGAMTFGRECDEALSHQLLDRFTEAGGTFIDTADVYSRGKSEEIVGSWLKAKDRESVVLATKVRFGTEDPANRRPNRFGLSRKHITAEVEASLTRLKTDYIDLYQVHNWDSGTPLEETLSTLNDLVRAGKVRYIGASNYTGWQLQKAIDLSRMNGWEHFSCLQPLYNLLDRDTEWELLPVCRNEGLGLIPVEPAARRLAHRQVSSRHGRAGLRHPRRDRRPAGLERELGALRQRADLDRGRRHRRHRQGTRQGAGPGGAQLAAATAGRHRADHRRPQPVRSSTAISAPAAGR